MTPMGKQYYNNLQESLHHNNNYILSKYGLNFQGVLKLLSSYVGTIQYYICNTKILRLLRSLAEY